VVAWRQGHYADGHNLVLKQKMSKIEFVSGRWIALRINSNTTKASLCIYDIQNPHADGLTLAKSYNCYQLCHSNTNDNKLMFYAIETKTVDSQFMMDVYRYMVLPGDIEFIKRIGGKSTNIAYDTADIWKTSAVSLDAFIVESPCTKYTVCCNTVNPIPWTSNYIIDVRDNQLYSRELSETKNEKRLCRYTPRSLSLGMILRRFWITYPENASISIYDTLEEQTSLIPAISEGTSQTLATNILGVTMLQNEQLVFCDVSELIKYHSYKGKTK
jgi:hypothetical protein